MGDELHPDLGHSPSDIRIDYEGCLNWIIFSQVSTGEILSVYDLWHQRKVDPAEATKQIGTVVEIR